ncbi:MAG TPA: chromate transporter [Mycobacteriales bacterium]|nr:chromate transporter [Mycobacteriales bacterium]
MAVALGRRRPAGQPAGRGWLAVFLSLLRVGSTAFGGGSATILALRQLVLRRGWLTEQEFVDTVVLSRMTPGIAILAQVLLIGKRVCGIRGAIAALVGLMLPAVTITIGLARLYGLVSGSPVAAAPLRGVAGMAAGFAIALVLHLLRDTLARDRRFRGPLTFAVYLGAALLIGNPLVVLLAAIAAGAAVPALFDTRTPDDES